MKEKIEGVMKFVREPASWWRVLVMGAFVVFLYLIVAPLIMVIMIAQILFTIFSGSPNLNLRDFSKILVEYIKQILEFVLYDRDKKPFPFSEFSNASSGENFGENKKESSVGAKTEPKLKPKTSPKRKAVKKRVKSKKPSKDGNT